MQYWVKLTGRSPTFQATGSRLETMRGYALGIGSRYSPTAPPEHHIHFREAFSIQRLSVSPAFLG
jgi:hypothetical protein